MMARLTIKPINGKYIGELAGVYEDKIYATIYREGTDSTIIEHDMEDMATKLEWIIAERNIGNEARLHV